MFISDFIGEATEYDKKLTLEEKKPKSWLKSVSAFANMPLQSFGRYIGSELVKNWKKRILSRLGW